MTRFTTHIRSVRVAGAVAALAVTAPLTVPAAQAVDIVKLRCRNGNVTTDQPASSVEWQSIKSPVFEAGLDVGGVSQEIVSHAVSPTDTRRLAITNGNSVYTSNDGGCSWKQSFVLNRVPSNPAVPLSGLVTTIKSVYVAPASNTFFALAEELETGATVGRPHVLRSESGEPNSWALADEGLPPLGKPLTLRGHPKDGRFLYLSFAQAQEEDSCPPEPLPCDPEDQQGRALGLLYASVDGGRTWQSRTDPGDLNSAARIRYFSVDDNDPKGETLWVIANGLLRKSTTGGRTYQTPDGLKQNGLQFTAVESLANDPKSDGLELVAFTQDRSMVRLHRGLWITSGLPFFSAVESVAQRPEGDIALATAPAGGFGPSIWRIYPRDFVDFEHDAGVAGQKLKKTYGWELITPPSMYSAKAAAGIVGGPAAQGAGTFYARSGNRLVRFIKSVLVREDADPRPIELSPLGPPRGRITPPVLDLDLPVNGTRKVDYTLSLPPSPTPLDVYLLVDNSGSMIPFITDLKHNLRDVALALHRSGIDVNIGVGQINVQPDQFTLPIDNPNTKDVDESKPKPIYQRLRKIGPVDKPLFDALDKLAGDSGGGDEPQLEALYQSITGKGLSLEGLGHLVGYQIDPKQDAGFRDPLGPIKVIVHATDEEFSTNIQGDAQNDPAVVGRVLREANVKQIGLSQDQSDAHKDLADMARRTGALAPAGGTDCDGDGRIGIGDVRAGQPLVCGESAGLDRTLLNLLNSLSDRQTLSLQVNASPAMRSVSRRSFNIDAKRATQVHFSVVYSCRGLEPGQYASDITGSLRGYAVAKAVATVTCGGVRVPVKVPPGAGSLTEPGNPPPPPQPQPVVPAPVPVNPVPQPQTQPQAQSQTQPQGGMADQEEEQFQVATAHNELTKPEDEQLAMTGLSYDDAAAGLVVALGMTMAGACAGLSLRRRSRTAAAKVTVRR